METGEGRTMTRRWTTLLVALAAVASMVGFTQAPAQANEAAHWSGPVHATTRERHYATALSCPATGPCTAVDTTGQAFRFDGTAWSAPVGAVRSGAALKDV